MRRVPGPVLGLSRSPFSPIKGMGWCEDPSLFSFFTRKNWALNVDRFKQDLSGELWKSLVDRDNQTAMKLSVQSTPPSFSTTEEWWVHPNFNPMVNDLFEP